MGAGYAYLIVLVWHPVFTPLLLWDRLRLCPMHAFEQNFLVRLFSWFPHHVQRKNLRLSTRPTSEQARLQNRRS